jgi:ABC-type nitrate/sulfonate/bicarbonate transport system permease component
VLTSKLFSRAASALLGIGLWLGIKYAFSIPDRYLPGFNSIGTAISDIGTDWFIHIGSTLSRVVIGYGFGAAFGVLLALALYRIRLLEWTIPFFNGVRAVPAVAIVPFFLLWFGFSEFGRYLLVIVGFGFNILIASADRLLNPREVDVILFRNLQKPVNTLVMDYWLPQVLEGLLPTLRFGIALAIGVIVVSEMLGAQWGLGYLMQTARATFSLNVIFVAALILGIMATILDYVLRAIWLRLINWRK